MAGMAAWVDPHALEVEALGLRRSAVLTYLIAA